MKNFLLESYWYSLKINNGGDKRKRESEWTNHTPREKAKTEKAWEETFLIKREETD